MTHKYKSIRYYFQELPRSKVDPARGLLLSVLALVFSAHAEPAAAPAAEVDARFEAAAARYVEEFGRYSPVAATQLGDHRFDGELEDMSAAGRARTIAWARGLLAEISALDRSRLTRPNQVDAAMLDNQLRYQIWSDERLRDWSWDPLVYTQLAGQSLYGLLARDYAPLPQRLSAATARLDISRPSNSSSERWTT